jgi:hypothetical protein
MNSHTKRLPDEPIFRHLGATVMLCWTELPPSSQETILNSAEETIGLASVRSIRSQIMGLLMRSEQNAAP